MHEIMYFMLFVERHHLAGLQGYNCGSVRCLAYLIAPKRNRHLSGTFYSAFLRELKMMCGLSGCSCWIYRSFSAHNRTLLFQGCQCLFNVEGGKTDFSSQGDVQLQDSVHLT